MLIDFREWEREGEREGDKHQCERETLIGQLPLICDPTWDQACNPGMCPDQESNPQPFHLWDDTRPTEPHQPGLTHFS